MNTTIKKYSPLEYYFPDIYRFLTEELNPWILPVYLIIYGVFLVLTKLVDSSIIEFFFDWLNLNLALTVALALVILRLSIKVEFEEKEDFRFYTVHHQKPEPINRNKFRLSCAWTWGLIGAAIFAFIKAREYKRYYSFRQNEFYHIPGSLYYHETGFFDEYCEKFETEENSSSSSSKEKIKGFDVVQNNYKLCPYCKESIDDAESDSRAEQWSVSGYEN